MNPSNLISNLRRKFNMSQEDLARAIKVSYTTINAWETGKRQPQDHMLAMLEELFEQESLPTDYCFKSNRGLVRSDAGYVSSLLDYGTEKDPNNFTHGIGRWYGCLPSFLVNDLIDFLITDFANKGEALVNFSGSGTVALELSLHGRKCSAIDVNPTALALTRVKTMRLTDEQPIDFQMAKQRLEDAVLEAKTQSVPDDNILAQDNRWLSEAAKTQVISICAGISSFTNEDQRLLLAVAAANTIVDFCNIDKRCTNHYVYKQNQAFDSAVFIATLLEEASRIEAMRKSLEQARDYVEPRVMWGDACHTQFSDETFDLVFSHPPYGTAVNYYSISRMQSSVIELVSSLAGDQDASSLRQCKEADLSSGTLKRFSKKSPEWVSEAARVLKKGGLFLTIIGDSRDGGKLSHPFTEVIAEGEANGLITKEIFIWLTNQKSGMHVKRKGNHIDHNYIIIMEKPND